MMFQNKIILLKEVNFRLHLPNLRQLHERSVSISFLDFGPLSDITFTSNINGFTEPLQKHQVASDQELKLCGDAEKSFLI